MLSPYAQVGAKLVERGYSALPVRPGSKVPGRFVGGIWTGIPDWQARYSARLPTEIETEHWSATKGGVCVVTGPASHDLVGIDTDVDDDAILVAIRAVLPPTPARKRGQKGETLLFRGPGVASRSFNEYGPDGKRGRRLVDIIAAGRQTVLPPTIHPDTGEPYRWVGEAALENVDPADLPLLTPDIGDLIAKALEPFGYRQDLLAPTRAPSLDAETPHRELNDAAMADLAAWVPRLGLTGLRSARGGYEAVPDWRPSSTGRPTAKRKPNLKIHPSGIRDMGADEPFTPLDLTMRACACDLDTAFESLSGWLGRSPSAVIELAARLPPSVSPDPPAPPASDLTRPPGLLGEITDWIVATSRRPNRMLALGAAITVLGTLVGRRLAGPTRSGTHLYVLGLARTGAGKDHPLTQVTRLMKAAKAGHHVGPDELMSMPAVIGLLMRSPLCICPMDEFGAFLKRVNSRRASGFEQGITKTLRSAWGRSFATLWTPEWAGRAARPVESPALSIYGVSTPEEFYGSLEGGDIINGFLNRFLVLRTDQKLADQDPQADPAMVPDYLVDALQLIYEGGNPLTCARLNDIALDALPEMLTWADDAARAAHGALLAEIETMIDRKPAVAPFLARTAEMSVRLATIRAVGMSLRNRQVSAEDVAWGRELAFLSAKAMANDAADFISENEHQAMAQRVLRIVREAGGEITQRDLYRRMKHAMRLNEMEKLLEHLKHSDHLAQRLTQPEGGGPITKWFSIRD